VKIKILLLISTGINLTLLGLLIYPRAPRPVSEGTAQQVVMTRSRIDATQLPPATSLSWSHLESSDVATFIRNLRSIGCPEHTIRNIIGDYVAGVYDGKRREMESQFGSTPAVLQQKLDDLQKEQTARVDGFLGSPPQQTADGNSSRTPDGSGIVSASVSSGTAAGSQPDENNRTAQTESSQSPALVRIPLAFVNPGSTSELTPKQQAQLQSIQQNFVSAVGGGNQNPADPSYLAAWQTAQEQADEQYKMLFGTQVFLQHHMQAFIASKAAQQAQ
jgi:hypothetical protein